MRCRERILGYIFPNTSLAHFLLCRKLNFRGPDTMWGEGQEGNCRTADVILQKGWNSRVG